MMNRRFYQHENILPLQNATGHQLWVVFSEEPIEDNANPILGSYYTCQSGVRTRISNAISKEKVVLTNGHGEYLEVMSMICLFLAHEAF